MSLPAEKVAEVLVLPAPDRAYLAHQLIASLDPQQDADAEAPWHTAITASKSILELEDDWDDQGSPRYAEATWQRAADFLVRQAGFARANLGRELPVPKILPGPKASIDLHWKLAGFELLVNIPSDAAQPATFCGDDYRNSCIRGNLNPAEEIRGLVVWLLA